MFTSTLPGNTGTVLKKLKDVDLIKSFYLSGETALSLQIGHRESQDLDFFNQNDFNPELIQKELES
ncbi:MAG: nucleotidyl transferase AbiEii/AbiGii toxin family protein [Patescibacteria group bacterium]